MTPHVEIRTSYGLAPLMAPRSRARALRVGDDSTPPHAGEAAVPFAISTDDVLDYARWLNPRMAGAWQDIINAFPAVDLNAPAASLPPRWREMADLIARWNGTDAVPPGGFFGELERSWWARVDSWDTVRGYHLALLDLTKRAQAEGVKMRDVAPPPPTPGEALWTGLGEVSSVAASLGVLAAGAAALYAVKSLRR